MQNQLNLNFISELEAGEKMDGLFRGIQFGFYDFLCPIYADALQK